MAIESDENRAPTYRCDKCRAISTSDTRCPKKECKGKMVEQKTRR